MEIFLFQIHRINFNIKRNQQGLPFCFRNNFNPEKSPNVLTFLSSPIFLRITEIKTETQKQDRFSMLILIFQDP